MVGIYEPYVEVCRRLAELWPCRGGDRRRCSLNSGAEAIENAVKIARAATGRAGVDRLRPRFHGRTYLTMAMTSKLVVQAGLRPARARGLPRAGAVSLPRRHDRRCDRAASSSCFKAGRRPRTSVACVVLEPVQGEGGFIPMPRRLRPGAAELLDDARHPLRRRRGPVGVRAHRPDVGDRALGVEPDLLVSGKTLGGGLPLAAVTGRAEVMDAVHPAASAAPSAATRSRARRRSPCSTSSPAPAFAERAEQVGEHAARHGSRRSRAAPESSARCAGSARCSRSSSPSRTATRRRQSRLRRASAGCCSSRAASTAT